MTESFGIAAREQQARFRETLPLPARTPSDDKGCRHGHLLALGHEIQNLYPALRGNGGALDFFERRHIKWWRSKRSGDQLGDGPTRNLASSQVACVNFLLPLAVIPGALETFLQSIDGDVTGIVPLIDKESNEAMVEFEWVGWDEPLEGGTVTRGANQTSVDALLVAKVPVGLRAYLLEWKHCEEYPTPEYRGRGVSGDTRRRRYRRLYGHKDSPFNLSAPFDEFLYEPFYQIMRLLLLADRMLVRGVTPTVQIQEAKVVIVCPQANLAYRTAAKDLPLTKRFSNAVTVEQVVHAALKSPRVFSVFAPESVIVALRRCAPSSTELASWLGYQHLRYGW
jgi:hypothetical protein